MRSSEQTLQTAGFEFKDELGRRKVRTPRSVAQAALPEKAHQRLQSRDERKQQSQVKPREERKSSVRVELGVGDEQEKTDRIEEFLDDVSIERERNGRVPQTVHAKGNVAGKREGGNPMRGSPAGNRSSQGPRPLSRADAASPGLGVSKGQGRSASKPVEPDAEIDDDVAQENGLTTEVENQARTLDHCLQELIPFVYLTSKSKETPVLHQRLTMGTPCSDPKNAARW